MAEWICRTLRDGGLEGEHAPALTINDTITCSLGSFVFDHILSQLSSFIHSQKSQSSGIVLVAFSRSPLYYEQLLKSKGYNVSASTWFKVLDCYTDPLGWKSKLANSGIIANDSLGSSVTAKLCKNVKDLDEVSEMLRHASVSSVASLLSELRSHGQVSSLFWLIHSDLHETRATAALEYISSMKATVIVQPMDGLRGNSACLSLMENNLKRGKFNVHVKRRNGRVKTMVEELYVENSTINFAPFSTEGEVISQSLVPKVQFNLQLSEKEQNDRAKVILPFEHQGDGKNIQIYDGRKSLNESKGDSEQTCLEKEDSGRGEIIYFRDSDDEMPDSDEDPDDDLDI
ncbi:elongator complex protein 5-like isoform X2 [Salvia splendens]|uniref:elongator complex protein 5-like isoform X2 n=1 Tax=Salvia splendens TaxID=180675 RepID=UPI001C27044B|nr:elongator complex protein 5-like isoform X2 [Salvia splendens]